MIQRTHTLYGRTANEHVLNIYGRDIDMLAARDFGQSAPAGLRGSQHFPMHASPSDTGNCARGSIATFPNSAPNRPVLTKSSARPRAGAVDQPVVWNVEQLVVKTRKD